MNSAKLGAIFGPDLCSAVLSQRPLASGSGPDLWSSLAHYRGLVSKVRKTGVEQTSLWVMVILVLCHRYPRGPSQSGDQFMTPTFEKRHQILFVLFDWCWRWDLLFGIRSTFRCWWIPTNLLRTWKKENLWVFEVEMHILRNIHYSALWK